jgi:rhomboid protease GluP
LALPLAPVRATYALLGVIVVMFILQWLTDQVVMEGLLLALGAKINGLIAAGELWRLVTPIFLHVGLTHIFFNGFSLYSLGPEVERWYGAGRFVHLFLLTGIAGVVMSLWLNPSPAAGASGALFGLIGAYGVFLYRNRRLLGERGRQSLQRVIIIAALNLLIGLQGFIDTWGHVGGLLGGLALGWVIGPVWGVETNPLTGQPGVVDQNRHFANGLQIWLLWMTLAGAVAAYILAH